MSELTKLLALLTQEEREALKESNDPRLKRLQPREPRPVSCYVEGNVVLGPSPRTDRKMCISVKSPGHTDISAEEGLALAYAIFVNSAALLGFEVGSARFGPLPLTSEEHKLTSAAMWLRAAQDEYATT